MNKKLNCIAFIDDDEPTNFLNKITTEQTDCTDRVEVFQSGEEALAYLRGPFPSPDLIFLDINMPAMDGWEFLGKYKELLERKQKRIVLIMLTTSENPEDEMRTIEMQEVACFENKPLKQPRLEDLLRRFFPQHFS